MSSLDKRHESRSDPDSISERIVDEVAAAEGVAPTALDLVLYDVVDPDALDALLSSAGPDLRVQFACGDHVVTVDASGHVAVTPS